MAQALQLLDIFNSTFLHFLHHFLRLAILHLLLLQDYLHSSVIITTPSRQYATEKSLRQTPFISIPSIRHVNLQSLSAQLACHQEDPFPTINNMPPMWKAALVGILKHCRASIPPDLQHSGRHHDRCVTPHPVKAHHLDQDRPVSADLRPFWLARAPPPRPLAFRDLGLRKRVRHYRPKIP